MASLVNWEYPVIGYYFEADCTCSVYQNSSLARMSAAVAVVVFFAQNIAFAYGIKKNHEVMVRTGR